MFICQFLNGQSVSSSGVGVDVIDPQHSEVECDVRHQLWLQSQKLFHESLWKTEQS